MLVRITLLMWPPDGKGHLAGVVECVRIEVRLFLRLEPFANCRLYYRYRTVRGKG